MSQPWKRYKVKPQRSCPLNCVDTMCRWGIKRAAPRCFRRQAPLQVNTFKCSVTTHSRHIPGLALPAIFSAGSADSTGARRGHKLSFLDRDDTEVWCNAGRSFNSLNRDLNEMKRLENVSSHQVLCVGTSAGLKPFYGGENENVFLNNIWTNVLVYNSHTFLSTGRKPSMFLTYHLKS